MTTKIAQNTNMEKTCKYNFYQSEYFINGLNVYIEDTIKILFFV